jgi:hypothetical protein
VQVFNTLMKLFFCCIFLTHVWIFRDETVVRLLILSYIVKLVVRALQKFKKTTLYFCHTRFNQLTLFAQAAEAVAHVAQIGALHTLP